MDREIPKEVRNKERNKKIIRYGGIGVASVIVISVLISFMRTGVKTKDLVFSTVDKGTIEVSVSASGKVVPAFEEIINSPINTRIVEIYKKGGDSVDIGTPILKLDLQSVETDYKKLLDEEQMRSYKLNQLRVNNQTKLNDLAMKIKVSAMQLNRKKWNCVMSSISTAWVRELRIKCVRLNSAIMWPSWNMSSWSSSMIMKRKCLLPNIKFRNWISAYSARDLPR